MAAGNETKYFGFKRTRGDASRVDSSPPGVPALIVPTDNRDLHIASAADEGTDWNVSNPTHPTVYVHSETTPATNYGSLHHDATDFVLTPGAGSVHIPSGGLGLTDDVSIELGTGDDSVIRHRAAVLNANTALTDVVIGTPVAQAQAADTLMISNVTADGDIAMYVNSGGHSQQALWLDASAKVAYLGQTGWAVNVLNGAVKVTLGTVSAFGTTQPTNTLVLRAGTAPAGTITTAVGLFTDGTTMKKIIADGTVSDVQT